MRTMPLTTRNHLRNQILNIIRRQGQATVKSVYEEILKKRAVSINTVATVMNRLVTQGLLVRQGGVRHYSYQLTPEDGVAKARALQSVENLLSEFGETGLVHFVDAVDEIEPGALEKLEEILHSRKKEKGHD